jgi:hypothetical protein
MSSQRDRAEMLAYVTEASRMLNLPLQDAWHESIAEHLARLFEAGDLVDASLLGSEPANIFEP